MAVRLQVPTESIIKVVLDTVQTSGVTLAKMTGLPEPPPVADNIIEPFRLNVIGVGGLKLTMTCDVNAADKTTLAGTWVALK